MAAPDSGFWDEDGAEEVMSLEKPVDIVEKYANLVEEAKIMRQKMKSGDMEPEDMLAEFQSTGSSPSTVEAKAEKFYMTNFGSIRLDSMNSPEQSKSSRTHKSQSSGSPDIESIVKGAVEVKAEVAGTSYLFQDMNKIIPAEEDLSIKQEIQGNIIEEQFFGKAASGSPAFKDISPIESYKAPEDLNEIDKMYFSSSQSVVENITPKSKPLDQDSLKDLNEVDQYYFSSAGSMRPVVETKCFQPGKLNEVIPECQSRENEVKEIVLGSMPNLALKSVPDQLSFPSPSVSAETSAFMGLLKDSDDHRKDILKRSKSETKFGSISGSAEPNNRTKNVYDTTEPKTAYDHVMVYRTAQKISGGDVKMIDVLERSEHVKKLMTISSDGINESGERDFPKLWQNLRDKPKEVVLSALKESIVHKGDDFLILNKPYGMAVHGTVEDEADLTLVKYLDELSKLLKVEKLYTVHRLDRNTTGGLILAKTQQAAKTYHDMLQEGQIEKQYLAITKGVPNPLRGTIQIPMRESTIDGRERMGLQPLLPGAKKPRVKTFEAVTNFKVLSQTKANSAALLVVRPETGIKHQIRVHLSLGLGTPILGDHKYSHETSFAPQRLSEDLLKSLKIRQQKVREMPMFLHASQLNFPKMGENGWDLKLRIPPPPLFRKVLKWLAMRKL